MQCLGESWKKLISAELFLGGQLHLSYHERFKKFVEYCGVERIILSMKKLKVGYLNLKLWYILIKHILLYRKSSSGYFLLE